MSLAVGVDGTALLARYRQLGLAIGSGAMPGLDRYSVLCVKAEDGTRQADGFGECEHLAARLGPALHAGRFAGAGPFGSLSQFPRGKLEELLDGPDAVVDAVGGRFTMHYTARW